MQSRVELEGTLERRGEELLRPGLRRYGRPGKNLRIGRLTPLGGATLRAGLRAIVRRTPEVMVKVTWGGRGMGAIKAQMAYISRRGELAVENELGQRIQGREELAGVAEEWQVGGGLIPTISHRRGPFTSCCQCRLRPTHRPFLTQSGNLPGKNLCRTNMPWCFTIRPPIRIRTVRTYT